MKDQPLAQIVDMVLKGNVNSFRFILERYQNYVFSIVHRYVPDNMVEDTAQEVFIRLFNSLSKFKKQERFTPWLNTIAVRTCYDNLRRVYRSKEITISMLSDRHLQFIDDLTSDQAHEQHALQNGQRESREILDHVMERLTPEERMVLKLVHFEGYTGREAAKILNWSRAKVKVQAYRSRKKLHGLLSELLHQGGADTNE